MNIWTCVYGYSTHNTIHSYVGFILSCCKLWLLCVIVHFPYLTEAVSKITHGYHYVHTKRCPVSLSRLHRWPLITKFFDTNKVRINSLSDIPFWCFVYLFAFGHPVCSACRILVPHAGIEPGHLAVKALSAKHWTIGELPQTLLSEWTNVICCRWSCFRALGICIMSLRSELARDTICHSYVLQITQVL